MMPLVELREVKKHFPIGPGLLPGRGRGWVKAVDGVSFTLPPGTTFSLVGESGCGKTTTARLVLREEAPTAGEVLFEGCELRQLPPARLRAYRQAVQAVFQDPWSSLNPRMRVGRIIADPLLINRQLSPDDASARVRELLEQVGLQVAHEGLFPHELSGGQRQRVAIARALALSPRLVVLDEPVSALDMSIRAQIMNLLKDLQQSFGLTYLLVAHHLGAVRYMSDQVGVMYLGKLVELAESEALFSRPRHPYTRGLLAAALPNRPRRQRPEIVLEGEIPSPTDVPGGCRFHPRCPFALPRCGQEEPALHVAAPGHAVACHLQDGAPA